MQSVQHFCFGILPLDKFLALKATLFLLKYSRCRIEDVVALNTLVPFEYLRHLHLPTFRCHTYLLYKLSCPTISNNQGTTPDLPLVRHRNYSK